MPTRARVVVMAALLAVSGALPALAGQAKSREAVEALIKESGADVAVAFRTLDAPGGAPSRLELLIQPDVEFHAASTMKVPVMIELFRQARAGLARLDEPLPVSNEFASIVDGSPYTLSVGDDSDVDVYKRIGQTMTLLELCEPMITVSSNFAANLLIQRLGAPSVQRTVRDLGADGMNVRRGVEDSKAFAQGLNNTTTARALMVLMERIGRLEAVDAEASRAMLEILKRQHFNDGIPAGLPPGIPVAHKTGSITKIHHDAAIVLAPRPFVLVVLVRGIEDLKQSAALIAKIARVMYDEAQAPPARPDYVRANYTKYEYRIPMRDGVKLFTSVYVPKDDGQPYPILLNRTPYSVSPYGADSYKTSLGPSDLFTRDGYIFVYQDVRGRMMSEGEFADMRPHLEVKSGPTDIDESSDTYDTIAWLLKNVPNHNGRVGMYGISYPGFYASAGMIDAHPALKAVSPQAPISDWFVGDDFHHNGALYLPHAFSFFSGFGRPRPAPTTRSGSRFDFGTEDGYQFYLKLGPMPNVNATHFKNDIKFWNELMAHETYDTFWQARNLRPHLKNIKPAVMTVGGWFDAEDLFGALETYKNVERQSPGASNMLVMGPWVHGGWARGDGDVLGDVRFGAKTAVFYREQIEFPFFSHYLKGRGNPALPEAYVFETGRNQWRRMETWPPAQATTKSLYLAPGGRLGWTPTADAEAFDEYVSDPARPVPYINHVAIGMTREHMVDDQRFASRRPDVLTYVTDVLDADVTVAGPISPSLEVSTSGTDSDWVVKLIDVYPDTFPEAGAAPENPNAQRAASRMGGYQQLVRGEAMRGKFRNSYETPEPFAPGQVTHVEYVMPDVFHTFRAGHRIMVQIQSSWFPLVNLNPQTFCNINTAAAADFKKATQRVYRSRRAASQIKLNILEGAW